ncbi:GNAT family N-acetyltransferase [Ancylobacter lacus]|uniref:GNAT family N-acetyltransferase n=1 Tax=Ancylobacter lacus TaxID=2579970 RepID=UPI001BD18472|nr:GNAT family N-acetyltransferase [Ancylobacter lacus]MBS7539625.1 GNAT family N-acetyltransferase [Ancylobacter lacus]
MPPDLRISDLRDVPDLAGIVAERIWRAWWEPEGVALAALVARLEESFGAAPVPTTWVARRGHTFVGTVGLIGCDVAARPELTPWVAALWVEPPARGAGLGTALAGHAAEHGFAAGYDEVHLAATPENAPFYLRRGWSRRESGVDGLELLVRRRAG